MNPYDRTTHDGKIIDWLTKCVLLDAEFLLGYELSLSQGSYNAGGVSASAGTHDGGGAFDLLPYDWANKVEVLRSLGVAIWHRLPSQGPWPEHCHGEVIGCETASAGAKQQWTSYANGHNGLANNGPDDGPRDHVNARYPWPGAVAANAKCIRNNQRFNANNPVDPTLEEDMTPLEMLEAKTSYHGQYVAVADTLNLVHDIAATLSAVAARLDARLDAVKVELDAIKAKVGA